MENYIEVNLKNIEENVNKLVSHYNDYKYYIGVVKGNGYGHGLEIVQNLIKEGINYLAVSNIKEAIEIRESNKDIPILILQPINDSDLQTCIDNEIRITIYSYDYYKSLTKMNFNGKLKCHLKVDSGMNRLGIKDKSEINLVFEEKNPNIYIEGIFSHFQTPGITDKTWDNQVSKFLSLTGDIDLNKIDIVHFGRSLTMINHPKLSFCNGVRLGIAMYGHNLTPTYGPGLKNKLRKIKGQLRVKKYKISETTVEAPFNLKEAYSIYSSVILTKKVNKGEYIGYGQGKRAEEDTIVAIVPIGYREGISIKSRNRKVAINGETFNIAGEIGMTMIIVEVNENINVGDKVELIGPNINLRYVSRYIKTTPYEMLLLGDSKLPIRYVKGDE